MTPFPELETTQAGLGVTGRRRISQGGQAVWKIPDDTDGHGRTILAAIAILLSALSGIDMSPEPSREDNQARAPLERIRVGEVAPDFTLRTPDGSRHRLSELRGRKNLVLIFFRGTW